MARGLLYCAQTPVHPQDETVRQRGAEPDTIRKITVFVRKET